ncbi:MAG TPA: hypothetical protein VEK57_21430 [Thermoanaerobaculia bacterium]|nr:hypothetical protein [Thermoanaerobaculia bacterium]
MASDDEYRVAMSGRWFLAFSFLLLAVHEAHELAHAIAGRLLCGEWPVRDFNSWHFTSDCASWLPTASGPAFSYALMLAGGLIAARAGTPSRWAGVALIFAANPFARLFTAVMGGGDEMVVGQRMAGLSTRTPALRIIVAAVVALLCIAAIAAGWHGIAGLKRRGLWFTVVLLWPMVLTGVGLFVLGNGLLRANVLVSPAIAGAPLLVYLVSALAAVLAAMTGRWLVPRRAADPAFS